MQDARAVFAIQLRRDERHAGLIEKGREGLTQVFLADGANGIEELRRGGATESVLLQISLHAFAKLIGPHPAFKHADDGGSLLIRDAVKSIADVVLRHDFLPDFSR